MFRRITTLFVVVVAGLLASTSLARADALTLNVSNSAGVELDGAYITTPTGVVQTDANGNAVLDVSAGQTIDISRTTGSGSCGDPDARSYAVPNPVPSNVSIVLPTLTPAAPHPNVSAAERYMVGLVNRLRAQNGLPPLEISTILTSDADRYAAVVPHDPQDTEANSECDAGDNYARVVDGGGQLFGSGGDVFTGFAPNPTAPNFFNALNVPGSDTQATLLTTNADAIGVAQESNTWVMVTGQCLASAIICGMDGDTGTLTAPANPGSGSSSSGHHYLHADRLRLGGFRYYRGAIYFTVTIARRARGQLKVSAFSGKHRGRLRREGRTYHFAVSHAGGWRLTAHFAGRDGWQTSTVHHTIDFN